MRVVRHVRQRTQVQSQGIYQCALLFPHPRQVEQGKRIVGVK